MTRQELLDDIWNDVVGGYDWLKAVIFGEFEDNRPISAVAADMLVSFVPGVIIVTSARDLVAVILRLARYPEKREEVGEWILLIGCTIPLILPILAAAVGAAAAGVGAVIGGIGGSEAGAALRAVCLMLIEKGGLMLEDLILFLRRFVKGDIFAVLRDIEFAKYGDKLAEFIDKSIGKLLDIIKGLKNRLLQLPQWQWLQNEIGPVMGKLQDWEHRFYDLQRSVTKNIPKALTELQSRLDEVLTQAKPKDVHPAQPGVHAEPPKPATSETPTKVATQRSNPLGTPPETKHPSPPPEPPKKENVHEQKTGAPKVAAEASRVATKPNTAFFWSGKTDGVGGAEVAAKIAREKHGTTLEMMIEEKGIKMPAWDPNDPASIKAWEDISEEYAQGVSGEVRGVIGQSLRPNNIWQNKELPALKANPKVTKITTIDPLTWVETVIYP